MCSFGLINTTASISGTNQLLSYSPTTTTEIPAPLDGTDTGEPFSRNWDGLINFIYSLSVEPLTVTGLGYSTTFLEDQLVPTLAGHAPKSYTSLPDNTTAERIAAFEDTLSRLSSAAYAIILSAMQSPSQSDPDTFVWTPPTATVLATQDIVVARLKIHSLQLLTALVAVFVLGAAVFVSVRSSFHGTPKVAQGNRLITGGVIETIVLMHQSDLPKSLSIDVDHPAYEKQRRWVASGILVE